MSQKFDPVACLQTCYGRWHETKGGCVDEWMDILADEMEFLSLAMGRDQSVSFTAPKVGKSEVRKYFDGLVSDWAMQHYTVDEMISQGDTVCVVCSTGWTNKRTGKSIDTPKVDVWKFKDGKAVRFFEYYDTAALLEAATP